MSMEVRDPIHGAIPVSAREVAILDDPFVQRLRNILQTGFSQYPFPGAVHSRYLHSVGVMHLAGAAFDSAFAKQEFSSPRVRENYRSAVRLAGLLHDIGHAPYSHCTEFAMPSLRSLNIGAYGGRVSDADLDRRGSHEDYTIGVLTMTPLAQKISKEFPFTATHVAALISRDVHLDDDFFVDNGLDFRRVLSQLISSELDVDRLDYLVRDSYFSGAKYGQVDVHWLINNLTLHVEDGQVSLAMRRRAIYAFDDFMVARYHMFVMVYFHHKSVAFEEMLKRYFTGENCSYQIPSSMEEYLWVDDVHLTNHLRQVDDPWARSIMTGVPWVRVLELHGNLEQVAAEWATTALRKEGIDTMSAGSVGKLSRYTVFGQKREGAPTIFVLDDSIGARTPVAPIQEATAIFSRYQDERRINRVYVEPSNAEIAKRVLSEAR